MNTDLILSLGVALIAGVLIGLERQTAIARGGSSAVDIGGIRTFPLIALSGGLAGLLAAAFGAFMPAVGLAALVVLISAQHVGKRDDARDPGITTAAAAVVAFLLGALATAPGVFAGLREKTITVVAIAVVVAILLSVKSQLHALSQRIQSADLFSALQLLVVAVVFLPLVPNQGFGPYEAFNPAQIGKMVVLIGVIGFLGFIASRIWGAGRGILVGGFIGGLVSSTAVTFTMARRARETPGLVASCALSVVAASSVMLVRVVLAAGVVFSPLLPRLAVTLVAMLLATVVAALPLWKKARAEEHALADVEVQNPFELKSALLFGVAFAVVILISRFARDEFGDAALYVAAAVAGLTDVDAITLSTANLAKDGLALPVATGVILTACFANTVVKASIAWASGGRALGVLVARVFGASVVVGLIVVVAQALLG
jgi:uncharacterized membrane protein (DUF4010 family)